MIAKYKINLVQAILLICFLTAGGCSKSGKDEATIISPQDLAVINDNLKDQRFIKEHFKDPDRVRYFLADVVMFSCNNNYQTIASNASLKRMERTNSVKSWLRGREKNEAVFRELWTDPTVELEGNNWKAVFNVFRPDGSVEKWEVVGENDPEREYNQIDKIEITTLKSKGTFS